MTHSSWPEISFSDDWLRQWARLAPASIAIQDGESGARLTYGELYYVSCALALQLKKKYGVQSGDRIALLATNEVESIALFFACLRLGAVLVPINFRLTAPEIGHILSDSAPSLLISQRSFDQTLAGTPEANKLPIWSFDGASSMTEFIRRSSEAVPQESQASFFREALRSHSLPSWHIPMESRGNAACMILYTSGTTGKPKGALVTPDMIFWNSVNTTLRLNLSQSDVFVSFLPLFHTGGWNVLLTPFLHRGAKTILIKKFDPELVLSLCEKERATILFGVPTTMEMMARSPLFSKTNLSTIRYAIVGGEPMSIDLIRLWQVRQIPIRQGFGMTEFGPNVFSLNEDDSVRKIGSIGFPNFYVEVRVANEQGDINTPGEVGELLLKGPMCTPGYWGNPSATADTIRDGWLHTGDLVRFDEEGYFYVAGRKKEMFISGGENVYPVEVERALSQHPEVREVAVIGVPDPKWGEVGRAYIVRTSGSDLTKENILAFCSERLARFKIPKQIHFMDELPKSDSGKILKRLLNENSQGPG